MWLAVCSSITRWQLKDYGRFWRQTDQFENLPKWSLAESQTAPLWHICVLASGNSGVSEHSVRSAHVASFSQEGKKAFHVFSRPELNFETGVYAE